MRFETKIISVKFETFTSFKDIDISVYFWCTLYFGIEYFWTSFKVTPPLCALRSMLYQILIILIPNVFVRTCSHVSLMKIYFA